jgi:hypothetical protein
MCSPSRSTAWVYWCAPSASRATLKIGMANIVYNLKRLIVLQRGRQAAA